MSILDAAENIIWTLNHSKKSYAVCREVLMVLQILLVNEELKFQHEKENENVRKG